MASQPVIAIKDLRKSFLDGATTTAVLQGVSLEILPTEFVILFGPSGSGKSTLLHILAGLESFEGGSVKIRGEPLEGRSEAELARFRRDKIGMVFQQFNLLRSLKVWENVAFPAVLAGLPSERRRRRALHLLELLELAETSERRPTELSGGQQQRVAIARAMMNNPWILLVDEPTGNLDSKSALQVVDLLDQLNRHSRRTILLVTHNQDYLRYADTVYVLKDGMIERKLHPRKRRSQTLGEPIDVDQLTDLGGRRATA